MAVKASTSTHARKVGRIAYGLRKQGYQVCTQSSQLSIIAKGHSASLAGIRSLARQPDVVAVRGLELQIIQVVTPDTLKADKEYLKTLIRRASKGGVAFKLVVTRPRESQRVKPRS